MLTFILLSTPIGLQIRGIENHPGRYADDIGYSMSLGTAPVGGTITGALREFNLKTSRAPGDWPEPSVHGAVRING